jgi:2-oxoisovalerate dehydrogenase E1 component alpha subunit
MFRNALQLLAVRTNLQTGSLSALNKLEKSFSTALATQRADPQGSLANSKASHMDNDDKMDFPGGAVPFTSSLHFTGGPSTSANSHTPIPCYRTIDSAGLEINGAEIFHDLDQPTAVKMYKTMVTLQTVDTIFYEAQRQGRFSFYMTSSGEEATAVGSAAALTLDDVVFSQYREQGVLMWRGFSVQDMADQCYGNEREQGKGRQMPVHYGSKALNFHTVSSPLATQLPHAAGAAYALKLDGKKAVSVAYFGEGAASEGDFHAALNFAATLSCPTIFICRNNGWAISTPATEQYRGDGIAGRGPSYGISTIRVDGGDARAVFNATAEARRRALETSQPVLIEAMSYRTGHHSTSDDSSRYRASEEMRIWRARDPVSRFQRWLVETKGWWNGAEDAGLRQQARKEAITSLENAAKLPKRGLNEMFSDVYGGVLPPHLEAQQREVMAYVEKYPDVCPSDIPLR